MTARISRYVPGEKHPEYLTDIWESELKELCDGLGDLHANLIYQNDLSYDVSLGMEIDDTLSLRDLVKKILDRESVFEEES